MRAGGVALDGDCREVRRSLSVLSAKVSIFPDLLLHL